MHSHIKYSYKLTFLRLSIVLSLCNTRILSKSYRLFFIWEGLFLKYRNDKSGLMFFDKYSGLNILFDEIPIQKEDNAPRHISIAITNDCNLNCSHCYIKHNTNYLDKNEVMRWVEELDLNGCLSIGIGGGEPTIHPNLLEILHCINKTTMAATITTNGSATLDYYMKVIKQVSLIRFSIDGFDQVYEKNRGQSFQNILNKLRALSKQTKIGINYLLTNDTVLQLDRLKELAYEIQPAEILLLPYISNNKLVGLNSQSIYIINNWLNKNKNLLPICLSYSGFHTFEFEYLPIQEYQDAIQDKYFLHITPDRKLVKNVFSDDGVIINNDIINAIKELGGVS